MLDANGINRWRVNDFSTEVTELHRFDVGQFGDDVSRADDLGVGRHEAIHVGPNLKHACFKSRSNYAGSIVATASTQVGHFATLDICADETSNNTYLWQFLPSLANQLVGQFSNQSVLACLEFCP